MGRHADRGTSIDCRKSVLRRIVATLAVESFRRAAQHFCDGLPITVSTTRSNREAENQIQFVCNVCYMVTVIFFGSSERYSGIGG